MVMSFIGSQTTVVLANDYGLTGASEVAGLMKAKVKGPPVIKEDPQTSLTSFAGRVIGQALTFVGILFFILMIYAGIVWMLARGNDTLTQKALGTITAAIIGLIIVIGSYAITQFIFDAATIAPTP